MKKLLVLLSFCLLAGAAWGQKRGNVWAFGNQVGMDFNAGSPPAPLLTKFYSLLGSASVCDTNGNLLFYTNGWSIWDRTNTLMPNGSDIATTWLTQAQPALIVPMPDSNNKYYVFSLGLGDLDRHGVPYANLFYSVVDMNLHGGLGDVVPGRKSILIDTAVSDKMIAILGDNCNIWVLTHKIDTSVFKAYEITGAGLNLHPVVSTTTLSSFYHHEYLGGNMAISPNRKKLVLCNHWDENMEFFDFNPATGTVVKHLKIDGDYYSACFSPDNTKLYIASLRLRYDSTTSVYQYDVTSNDAATIVASRTRICVLDSGITDTWFTDIGLGPDGHMYFGERDYQHMGSILYPNLSGTACTYAPAVVAFTALPFLIARANTFPECGLPNAIVTFKRDTLYDKENIKVCFKDSILITRDTAGSNYLWDDGSVNYYRNITKSGKYWVTYTTPPCVHHYDTFTVAFYGRTPIVGSYSGCAKDSNSYMWARPEAGDTTTYTYTWLDATGTQIKKTSRSLLADTVYGKYGIYYLHISLPANGCDTQIQFFISRPRVSFIADTETCVGDTVKFINTTKGNYASYQWYFGDGDTSSADSTVHVYTTPGVYYAMLVGLPCQDTAFATITIDSIPYVRFVTDKKDICLGEPITFYPTYRSGASSLLWNFGDNVTVSKWAPVHSYDQTGRKIITVVAKYDHCPDTSFKDTISVYPYPVVNLGSDTALCPGQAPILIEDKISQPTGYQNMWNTGEATDHIVASQPGTYWLMVTSDHGCSTVDTEEVKNNCYINIPNAFTPNGDGTDDYFFPRQLLSMGVTAFHMQIFNRWGEKIFETQSIDGRGWDGRFNNIMQPTGVYIYIIEVNFINGVHQQYKGNVTLL